MELVVIICNGYEALKNAETNLFKGHMQVIRFQTSRDSNHRIEHKIKASAAYVDLAGS